MPVSTKMIHGLLILYITALLSLSARAINPLTYLRPGKTTSRTEESTFLIPGDPECDYDCQGEEKAYFCASNGRTLDSECKVERAMCNDPMLEVSPGKCQDSTRCEQQRRYSIQVRNHGTHRLVHIPDCQEDGSYAPVQCQMSVGYCWCVTPVGKMVRNSTVKIGNMPPCGKRKSKCKSEAEKVAFAMKLRVLIVDEYRKRSAPAGQMEWNAVAWKHEKMDKNKDGFLSSREMKKLLRQYKRKLPRPCVKVFWKYCDSNGDRKTSGAEWKTCLGTPYPVGAGTRAPSSPSSSRPNLEEETEPINDITTGPSPDESVEPGTAPILSKTCKDVKQEILRYNKKNVKIPQCEGLNLEFWAPVQCHEATGYCYCAVRETGHPISGTSVTRGKPNCNKLTTSSLVSVPIPGCPDKLKVKFLREVQNMLIQEMLQAEGHHGEFLNAVDADSPLTTKERAARWYFHVADENHDRVLTRKENKNFKKLLSSGGRRISKKCLRKFTQHCDRNRNRKTTEDEFVACLEVRQQKRLPRRPEIVASIEQLQTTDDPERH